MKRNSRTSQLLASIFPSTDSGELPLSLSIWRSVQSSWSSEQGYWPSRHAISSAHVVPCFSKHETPMYRTISFTNYAGSLAIEGFLYCAQSLKVEIITLLSTYASSPAPRSSALTGWDCPGQPHGICHIVAGSFPEALYRKFQIFRVGLKKSACL